MLLLPCAWQQLLLRHLWLVVVGEYALGWLVDLPLSQRQLCSVVAKQHSIIANVSGWRDNSCLPAGCL